MHEHTAKHIAQIRGASNRAFGLLFCAVSCAIAFHPLMTGGAVRQWALLVGLALLLLALVSPQVLAPANRLWMKIGEYLHAVVSPVALGIVFYFAVLPTGIILRLLGKDPLRLRMDSQVESYWIKREPPGPDSDSLNNQF